MLHPSPHKSTTLACVRVFAVSLAATLGLLLTVYFVFSTARHAGAKAHLLEAGLTITKRGGKLYRDRIPPERPGATYPKTLRVVCSERVE